LYNCVNTTTLDTVGRSVQNIRLPCIALH